MRLVGVDALIDPHIPVSGKLRAHLGMSPYGLACRLPCLLYVDLKYIPQVRAATSLVGVDALIDPSHSGKLSVYCV